MKVQFSRENVLETIKEEPVSSTSGQESETESQDEKPPTLNVLIKQHNTSNDYVNDPEAGPSGIKRESTRKKMFEIKNPFDYSDESDDETPLSMWNRQQSWKNESNDIPDVEPNNVQSNQAVEIIDLIDNEATTSNDTESSNKNSSDIEILTLPELQLDWASDSSDEDEISSIPNHEFKSKQSDQTQSDHGLPAIDLTLSDDDDIHVDNHDEPNNGTEPDVPRRYNGLFDEYHNVDQRNGAGHTSFGGNRWMEHR